MYGTQYAYIVGAIFLMSVIMAQVYLPVFHELKITSNYEVPKFSVVFFTFACELLYNVCMSVVY